MNAATQASSAPSSMTSVGSPAAGVRARSVIRRLIVEWHDAAVYRVGAYLGFRRIRSGSSPPGTETSGA
jgi:hypothetical protein